MTTLALGHVNLRAPRELLDALKDFYCDVVGLRQGARPPFPGFGYWLYAGDRAIVHLYEAEPGEERRTDLQTTLDHFAFDCADRVEVEKTLKRLGVAYRTATVPSTRQLQITLRDPAGNHVELSFAGSED
jgi:catechol 2,3-dioxygenase-like lactoylglutathione lyase family enzyme